MNNVVPFSSSVPVIGQPVTILAISLPVNATLQCNCGGDQGPLEIKASSPQTCSSCGTLYNVAFNPQNGQIQITAQKSKPELAS